MSPMGVFEPLTLLEKLAALTPRLRINLVLYHDESLVMGYYLAQDAPMADFFAREFAVCDHWFSALPTGTQPNRLMAMSGIAARDKNAPFLLTDQDLVYDWLDQHDVSWRVYHQGPLPFFALMKKWQLPILRDLAIETLGLHTNFRRYEHFESATLSRRTL